MSQPSNSEPHCYIRSARSPADIDIAKRFIRAYAQSLNLDLSFQNFEIEVATLPGKYSPPSGEILLAFSPTGEALGCVALRPLDPPGYCEMKRLYVLPRGRGFGGGRSLVDAIIEKADAIGYNHMRLDTLRHMKGALALYSKVGFEEVDAYYDTPLKDTVFMQRMLQPKTSQIQS